MIKSKMSKKQLIVMIVLLVLMITYATFSWLSYFELKDQATNYSITPRENNTLEVGTVTLTKYDELGLLGEWNWQNVNDELKKGTLPFEDSKSVLPQLSLISFQDKLIDFSFIMDVFKNKASKEERLEFVSSITGQYAIENYNPQFESFIKKLIDNEMTGREVHEFTESLIFELSTKGIDLKRTLKMIIYAKTKLEKHPECVEEYEELFGEFGSMAGFSQAIALQLSLSKDKAGYQEMLSLAEKLPIDNLKEYLKYYSERN